jgi:hypothetical protein
MTKLQKVLADRGASGTSGPEELVARVSIGTQAVLGCDPDKPSLGAFTCYLIGMLEARMATGGITITCEFNGIMFWFDIWDFDPMRPALPGEEAKAQPAWRTKNAEEKTRMAAESLPGVPFKIYSIPVPIRQEEHGSRARVVTPMGATPNGCSLQAKPEVGIPRSIAGLRVSL